MRTEADRAVGQGAGVPLLLIFLVLLAAGPVIAPSLPSGPASLLAPRSVAVAVACLLMVWTVFLWPVFLRLRSTAGVCGNAAQIALAGAPFLVGVVFLAGREREGVERTVLLPAALVLGVVILVTALYLSGPGWRDSRDRWFAAGATLVLVVIPFANYAVNEFAGVSGSLGYRISPLLLVRRILLGYAEADATPFLVLSGVLGLGLLAVRWRKATAAGALLLLAAVGARGQEVAIEPLLGDVYVPGRSVPFRMRPEADLEVRVPGFGRYSTLGSTLHLLPLSGRTEGVQARIGADGAWRPIDLGVRPVKRWVVCLAPVPEWLASARGVTATRSLARFDELGTASLLAVDGVFDPGGIVPERRADVLRSAGIRVFRGVTDDIGAELRRARGPGRRIWEEGGDPAGLLELFPTDSGDDSDRAGHLLLILGGFSIVAVAYLRFSAARGWTALAQARDFGFLSVFAVIVLFASLRAPVAVRAREFVMREGSRVTTIVRLDGRRAGTFEGHFADPPLVVGGGGEARYEDGYLRLDLRERETRLVVCVQVMPAELPPSRDLEVGPEGLNRPGAAPMSPVEFLLTNFRDENGRPTLPAIAIRRLLRLADLPGRKYGVSLPGEDRPEMHIWPLEPRDD